MLLTAYDACRTTGRELMIEIIASKHGPLDETTTAAVVRRLYGLGIRPDWWKLEPQPTARAWRCVEAAIRTGDAYCRGVVLLGLEASEDHLVAAFALAAANPIVKGFAVGRTIFAEPAEAWLAGTMSDGEAVAAMASRFRRLSEAWDRAMLARAA
jgi:5-dehydro-2-deoxygluconokinase